MPRSRPAAITAIAAGFVLAVAVPLSASAHVTLTENTAAPGGFALIQFKVPNESESATTTSITVQLPTKTALSVSYVPVAGWTTKLVTTKLDPPVTVGDDTLTEAVSQVTWTASGTGISDGQLQLFPLSLGPIPDTGSITFPVTQVYSDGTTVSWSDTGESAEHPAPVLYVNDAPPSGAHPSAGPSVSPSPSAQPQADAATSTTDVVARVLGVAGLVVGVIGVVLALGMRRRRSTP